MTASRIDLHLHTNASDGVLSPPQLLELVRSSGLSCFAVTDHDTLSGADLIRSQLTAADPACLTGVELSVNCEGADMHMLAYCFDAADLDFRAALTDFQQRRRERGSRIVERLQQQGVAITAETVARIAGNSVVGRPHIAEALIEHRVVRNIEEAFRKYLGYDAPAYVPKATWAPAEAIAAVHAAGGVAIMAHPGISDMQRFIVSLIPLGLDGIEVFHTNHTAKQTAHLLELALRHELLISGGTDFHGRPGRNAPLGMTGVTAAHVDAIRNCAAKYASEAAPSDRPRQSPTPVTTTTKGSSLL